MVVDDSARTGRARAVWGRVLWLGCGHLVFAFFLVVAFGKLVVFDEFVAALSSWHLPPALRWPVATVVVLYEVEMCVGGSLATVGRRCGWPHPLS